jgi:hypothetical protein
MKKLLLLTASVVFITSCGGGGGGISEPVVVSTSTPTQPIVKPQWADPTTLPTPTEYLPYSGSVYTYSHFVIPAMLKSLTVMTQISENSTKNLRQEIRTFSFVRYTILSAKG